LMPYHYLVDIGTADIAFEATGRDLPELFIAAADATIIVMIDNLDAIESRETRQIELSNDQIDMLLFDFLQELIYFKDAERLLLMATRSLAFLTGCLFTSWITSPSRRPALPAGESASISAITAPLMSFERLSALRISSVTSATATPPNTVAFSG